MSEKWRIPTRTSESEFQTIKLLMLALTEQHERYQSRLAIMESIISECVSMTDMMRMFDQGSAEREVYAEIIDRRA